MAFTTPSRTMAMAALALSAAVGVGADGTMVFSRPCPMSRLASYQAEVHQTCDADIAQLCRPQDDPFEALFGGSLFGPSLGGGRSLGGPSPFASDPFFRSVFDSDPFFRMAMTPPGIRSSPSLLDEFFGETVRPPPPQQMEQMQVQQQQRREEEKEERSEIQSIASILDGMMDTAMKFALEGPPEGASVRVIRFGPDGIEEQVSSSEQAAPVESELVKKEEKEEASPADVAEAALERIVNSFLGHTVSASASTAASADGAADAEAEEGDDEEEEDAEHPQAPRVVDADAQREVLSHDEDTDDALEDEPNGVEEDDPIETSYGSSGIDPVAIARQMAEYGKKILQSEDQKVAEAEAAAAQEDPELRRRRRLSEDHPEIRRRLARRLQEVSPFVGMPTRIQLVPLGGGLEPSSGSPLRVVLRQPEEQRSIPRRMADVHPRLMLGPQIDSCLWDAYEAGRVSEPCGVSLSRTKQAFVELRKQDERRQREVLAATLQHFAADQQEEEETLGSAIVDALFSSRFLLVAVWCFFFLLAVHACMNEGDDDDGEYYYDDDDERNPDDYVALSDHGSDGEDERDFPAARNAARVRSENQQQEKGKGSGVVYVAVPVQVV